MGEQLSDECCVERCFRFLLRRDWQLVEDRQSFCRDICVELVAESLSIPRAGEGSPRCTGQLVNQPHPSGERSAQWERLLQRKIERQYSRILYRSGQEAGTAQERAFAELIAYLYRIAYCRLGDQDAARDLVQTALEKLWRGYDTCRAPESFLAFAAAILRNASSDWADAGPQKRTVEGKFIEMSLQGYQEETGQEPAVAGEDQTVQAEVRDIQRRLAGLLREHLSKPNEQTVAILSFVHGMPPRDIAAVLELPPERVRVHKNRALQRLLQDAVFIEELRKLLGSGGDRWA